jgi:glucoamylase
MHSARAAAAVCVAVVAALALSGGSRADPATPPAIPGLPPPFLGTAVVGGAGTVGAVDSYGNVVEIRRLGTAGREPADSGIVAGAGTPYWLADAVRQNYLPGTNVLRTVAHFGGHTATVVRRLGGVRADRRWLGLSRPLGSGAPVWARRLYRRSLLVLRALTDRRSGATIAGAREGWAYVWPRDAATVAIALAAAGHRAEGRRVVEFLERLDLEAAARFDVSGEPVDGRAAQGDAAGWVDAAARAVGMAVPPGASPWRGLADYQEKEPGDYLANAIAAGAGPGTLGQFRAPGGLVRGAGSDSLDAAAAWAVRPFRRRALIPAARTTLLGLAADRGRFGITPSEDWPEDDPWTAPTAWCAWGLAALGERRPALELMADLRRAATPLGLLPERVDAQTGIPRSTTPLAWSHAFAILALRALWPGPTDRP